MIPFLLMGLKLALLPVRKSPEVMWPTAIPPAVPLAAEPSVAEPTSGEFAPGLGKINPVHIIHLFVCSH